MKKKNYEKAKTQPQGERQRARARTGTSANERKPEEAWQQNQGTGKGQGQRERNKPSKQTSMERVSTRRKGKRQRRQRKRITSAVNRLFTSMVQCATETDLCLLLDESSWRNGVYTYDHVSRCRGQSPGCWGDSTSSTATCTTLHLQNPSESSALISNAKCCGDGTVTPRGSWMEMHLGESPICVLLTTQNFLRRSSGFGCRISDKQ